MRRPGKEPEEPLLFDLPLDSPEPAARDGSGSLGSRGAATRPQREPAPRAQPLPIPLPLRTHGRSDTGLEAVADTDAGRAADPRPGGIAVGRRLSAALADLALHGAVLAGLYFGSRFLGLRPGWNDWPAGLLFALPFSFLYSVVPLAFWGKTPGMASAGLASQNAKGDPLTFDQTARRWLGGLLTLATAGIPLLVTRHHRSLADLLSGSVTLDERTAA